MPDRRDREYHPRARPCRHHRRHLCDSRRVCLARRRLYRVQADRLRLRTLAANPRRSAAVVVDRNTGNRSEEHTSELQSLMRISYAVFCLTKKKTITKKYKL